VVQVDENTEHGNERRNGNVQGGQNHEEAAARAVSQGRIKLREEKIQSHHAQRSQTNSHQGRYDSG